MELYMNIDAATGFWALAGVAASLVPLAALGDRRQAARKNLDRPGWVSWPVVQILSLCVAVVAMVLALKS